ncbi:MAG: response regulator [Planctomycetes bacterium]|nr:response regulator [Planctomycetota bacterium]
MVVGTRDRILFVDDDRSSRWLMKQLLGRWGYSVDVAGSSQEALELIEERDFVLAIMDFAMPETDGVELFRRLRELRPRLRGICLTGYATPAMRQAVLEEGLELVLEKPVVLEELAPILQHALWQSATQHAAVQ